MQAAPIRPTDALFLDLDGTVLDIAASPNAVRVPAELPEVLHRLCAMLGGALAILSGRPLAEVDRLCGRGAWSVAAEHGAVRRWPDGSLTTHAHLLPPADDWLHRLRRAAGDWPGVLIEEKVYSLVAHYRQAPERAGQVQELCARLAAEAPGMVELLPARMAVELRPRGVGKGGALLAFMDHAHFAGRPPVFVGDDVTDEEAIAAVRALDGIGLHVARDFGGEPALVRQWLRRSAADQPPENGTGLHG